MTLRTPRRRISPRAKRRYRVIRDFFRRALGSSSQQDIKINSSIAVNVTDLKHKIVGIEHQLNEVSRHCQDLACIESTIRKGAENLLVPECNCQREVACSVQGSTVDTADKKSVSSATKVSCKPLDTLRRKSDESDYVSNANYRSIEERKHMTLPANMAHEQRNSHFTKHRQRKSKVDDRLRVGYDCGQNFQKRRTRSTLETFEAGGTSYATTSYHSLAPPPIHTECPPPAPRTTRAPCLDHKHSRHQEHGEGLIYNDVSDKRHKHRSKRNKSASPQRYQEEKLDRRRDDKLDYIRDDKLNRNRKVKKERSRLDQDYITEIIQKQYKPTKMFGRKNSEISQFSMPVCRDQEYSLHENIQEGTDLCSCCYEREAYRRTPHHSPLRSSQCHHHNHYDCRSVCDTRLYSSKRARAPRRYRHVDIYNDATLYDVVPVKEKPSPKSRRKFVEDNIIGYEYYKEVPPSPRTHRPRLNLKAQHHADYEEYVATKHANKSYLPERQKRHYEYPNEYLEYDEVNSEFVHHREKCKQLRPIKVQTSIPIEHDNVTMSNLQGHSFENEQAITLTENSLNKTQDTEGSDKTDKALCEIKDILQCFLQEIKKETTSTDKDKLNQETQAKDATGAVGASGVAGNIGVTPVIGGAQALPIVPSYTVAQCSVPNTFSPFTNPCCYPMLPMCPINCMQNGCPARSTSCTCHSFSPNKETMCQECSQKKGTQETDKNNETDELIKEIYKFVTLNPNSARKRSPDHRKETIGKKLTSRSVGDSSRVSRHDANVATSAMKCYSKSCEAIGSRMITETSYTTTQSDTVLEKLSLDVSRSDSELTTEVNVRGKSKPTNKITSVLRSIGLFKKKKAETESSFEVDIMPKEKRPPPFRQEIYDYAMHEQEFYHSPPYVPRYDAYGHVPPPPGCEHRGPYYAPGPSAPPGNYTPHRVHEQTIPEHEPHCYHSHAHPSAPPYHDPYDSRYNPHAPQGPLCLKEIEVKSTGTQSERKMSFFRKIGRKTPPGMSVRSEFVPQPRFTEGTQTQQTQKLPSQQSRPLFPGWKKFQDKVQKDLSEDPLMYGYKTKQKLMDGDKKLKSAMVKKMFYKRNPFSPNNLIIRTLLGNDPSSFGEPNVNLKPRIFF